MKNKTFLKIPALLILAFSFFAISSVSNADEVSFEGIKSSYKECNKGNNEACVRAESLLAIEHIEMMEKADALNNITIIMEENIDFDFNFDWLKDLCWYVNGSDKCCGPLVYCLPDVYGEIDWKKLNQIKLEKLGEIKNYRFSKN